MKKETVIRQNKCDREMKFIFYVVFLVFMSLQLLGGGTQHNEWLNRFNMVLYGTFVPGFLFLLGYCSRQVMCTETEYNGRKQIFGWMVRYFIYYFVLQMLHECMISHHSVQEGLITVLSLNSVSTVSALFFTLALVTLVIWVFYKSIYQLSENNKAIAVVGALCLLCSFLSIKGESYTLISAFTGSDTVPAVPGLPYFAYFLFGMWTEKKKPGFQIRPAVICAVLSVVSLALYGTPAGPLCKICFSALPVYVVYVLSEFIYGFSVGFKPLKVIFAFIEPVGWIFSFLIYGTWSRVALLLGPGIKNAVIFAVAVIVILYLCLLGFWGFCKCYGALEQKFSQLRHQTLVYFLVYTVVFAFLMVLVFLPFILKHKTLLWSADGITQYYPRAVYFTEYIREMAGNFLKGNFNLPMYDFRLGFGSEVTYSLEPVYFLFALFGKEHVVFTYTLLICLRFYLSGITSSIFFLYFKKDYVTTFIASVVYVFCGFSLFGGARHAMFMVPMILLPLLIIAIEEIIRSGRWYLCTIFVALSLFSNYYYLYMSTIGMGIYFLVRFFTQPDKKRKSVKNFFVNGFTIAGSYLLGVAMSCIVLATTFGAYLGSSRSGSAIIKTPSLFFYNRDWILTCFLTFITTANSPGDWLKLGFLPIAFVCVVFLFARKGRKELKILSVIGGLMMLFPAVGLAMNGFSSVSNRWCYLIALLVAYIVADCLPDMRQMERREALICIGAVLLYGFFAFFGTVRSTQYTKWGFIWLCATLVVIFVGQDTVQWINRHMKQGLVLLLTVFTVFFSGYSLYDMADVVSEYAAPGEAESRSVRTPLAAVSELNDDSFYRAFPVKLDYKTISSSTLIDQNSTSMFYSTLNSNLLEYMEKTGCTGYSATQLFGFTNRSFMNELAAVKYCAYFEDVDKTIPYGYEKVLDTKVDDVKTTVCENQFALPLGYTYSDSITEEELEQYDVAARPEVMLQKVVLKETEESGTAKKNDVTVSGKKLTVNSVKEKGIHLQEHSIEAQKDKGKVTLRFQGEANAETYLVMKNAVLKGDMSERAINLTVTTDGNKQEYKFRSDDDRYGSQQPDYIINMGYHEDAITECTIKMDRIGVIDFDSLELYSQPMDQLKKYSDQLKESVLENVSIGTNTVSGTITLDQDKTLVLSIPYQNGWTAWVDGNQARLQRANYMYLSLPLSAGKHTIQLKYEIPGVKYSLIIMPAAFALFLVLCLLTWILKKVRKNKM